MSRALLVASLLGSAVVPAYAGAPTETKAGAVSKPADQAPSGLPAQENNKPSDSGKKPVPADTKSTDGTEATPTDQPGEGVADDKPAERLPPPAGDYTAAEVAAAPRPGTEGGRVDGSDRDSTARNIAQGFLLVPKVLFEAGFAPIRATIWSYEHYSLGERFHRAAFDETDTYGVTPMLHVNSTYGATVGGRFVHRNLFGDRERFALRAGFGGEYDVLVDGRMKSGHRLGKHVWLELRGEYEGRRHDPFYGIGNSGPGVEARHTQELKRGTATLDVEPVDDFHVVAASALTDANFGVSNDGAPIDTVYDVNQLTGWTGVRDLYNELELRYDTRRITPSPITSVGVLVDAFIGRMHQLEAGEDYWRYGGELIYFQPLGIGRTLATRVHYEAVNGNVMDVPFTQLPQLGGKSLLRGYQSERFRDRTALAGSAEYMWDISSFLLASLFVDVGRVYSGVDDVTFDDMRMGYGASLQLVSKRRFIAGVSVASSIDGGMFLNLVLDPVYEPEPRVRQK